MASIQKLSVRGIRAFSPDDDEQVISFSFPLTIIVGANGCGKTTIIEALKYAVTGSLPPGNKSGQAFVHDPKSVGSSNVKASIKLRFTNCAGKQMVVIRSMEVTQKKTTMSFKALDGILRTRDEDGNRQALSHKCGELDRQIPQLLGVSKAVLESVVFCHQEDSSWPLMEGAVLKKRFDDIFDSTRYVKALDAIKDTKKTYAGKVKDYYAELNLLSGHKHAAQGFRTELNKTRQALSDYVDKMRELDEERENHEEQSKAYSKILNEVDGLNEDIKDRKQELEKKQVEVKTRRDCLEKDLTTEHDRQALQDMISFSDTKIEEERKKLTKLEMEKKNLELEVEVMQRKTKEQNANKGKLLAEKNQYEKNLRERLRCIDNLASKYGLELNHITLSQNSDSTMMDTQTQHTVSADERSSLTQDTFMTNQQLTIEDMNAFHRSVATKMDDMRTRMKQKEEISNRQIEELQQELNILNSNLLTTENEIKTTKNERSEAMNELQKISRNVKSSSRLRKSDVDDAKRQCDKFARHRDEISTDPRRQAIPNEIKTLKKSIEELKHQNMEDKRLLDEVRKCSEEKILLDSYKTQLARFKDDIKGNYDENCFLLQKYDLTLPDLSDGSEDTISTHISNLREKCDVIVEKSENDWKQINENFRSVEKSVSQSTFLLDEKKKSISSRRGSLITLSGRGVLKIQQCVKEAYQSGECAPDISPEDFLNMLSKKIDEKKLDTTNDPVDSIERTMRKLKKMMTTTNGVCPCCTKRLENDEEVNTFLQALKNLPKKITSTDTARLDEERSQLKRLETWHKTVSQNMIDWNEHKRITSEVNELEAGLIAAESALSLVKTQHCDLTEKLHAMKIETDESSTVQEVVNAFTAKANDISSKLNEINDKEDEIALLAPNASKVDQIALEKKVKNAMEEKDDMMNKITSLNDEASELNERISKATIQATRSDKILKEREEKLKEQQASQEKKQQLNEVVNKCKDSEARLTKEQAPIRQKTMAKTTEIGRLKNSRRSCQEKENEILNAFKSDIDKITSLSKDIDEFVSSNKSNELETIDSKLAQIESKIQQGNQQLVKMREDITSRRNDLEGSENGKKNVEDNVKFLDLEREVKRIEDDVTLLEDKRDSVKGADEASEQYIKLKENIRSIESEQYRNEGNMEALKSQQRILKTKLNTAEYRDVDERHRIKMIEHETCSLAVKDLDTYHAALDKALLRYHGLKVEEINKIIKELWALTYRGEDIANIRITSDKDKKSRAKASYNYRVVMMKGATELDMRGRCSAGQRVLASLVIRLALAETFCLNCGIMALDEPTTNLDFKNKKGLAVALAQIISMRAAQHNFQLAIITHDEDFVTMMKHELAASGGINMPEKYFSVSREEGSDGAYYSKIHAVDWEDL